ncbi:putative small auxin-up RNA [Helianthus annuus]|nr:putative small auxin-up RNA [Helianthus annuus]
MRPHYPTIQNKLLYAIYIYVPLTLLKIERVSHRNYQWDVPKGHLAVYVGEKEKRRFVIPISYLQQPLFQKLLRESEEEFGFDHSMGGLTLSCQEDAFFQLTSVLHS